MFPLTYAIDVHGSEATENLESLNKEDINYPEESSLQKCQNQDVNCERMSSFKEQEKEEIELELIRATNDQYILHVENVQKLLEYEFYSPRINFNRLKDKCNTEENLSSPESYDDFSPFVYKHETHCKNKQCGIFSQESLKFQAEYLRSIILKLEDIQTAESIKYVIDCRKRLDYNEYEFNVIFDEAISGSNVWIPVNRISLVLYNIL